MDTPMLSTETMTQAVAALNHRIAEDETLIATYGDLPAVSARLAHRIAARDELTLYLRDIATRDALPRVVAD